MPADHAVLAVHRYAGEVAHMLVGAGELVEEGGLAAVLVAHQRKAQSRPLRQGIARALGVEFALLAETRMIGGPARGFCLLFDGGGLRPLNADVLGVGQAQRQLIPAQAQLHGVAHGRKLDHGHLHAGDEAHIQKMLPQRAFAADACHAGGLARLQFVQLHVSLFSMAAPPDPPSAPREKTRPVIGRAPLPQDSLSPDYAVMPSFLANPIILSERAIVKPFEKRTENRY